MAIVFRDTTFLQNPFWLLPGCLTPASVDFYLNSLFIFIGREQSSINYYLGPNLPVEVFIVTTIHQILDKKVNNSLNCITLMCIKNDFTNKCLFLPLPIPTCQQHNVKVLNTMFILLKHCK